MEPASGKGFARAWPGGLALRRTLLSVLPAAASAPALSLDQLRRFPAADVMVDHARDWLTGIKGQPFFLWLHLMDPHSPYYPRREALEMMQQHSLDASRARYLNSYWNRGDLGASRLRRHCKDVIALYDAGIRWVDAQVARLVETLRGLGVWENCVMALTADHGEEFLDHGGRYHPPSKVSEELVRVPLLLRAPGLSPGSVECSFQPAASCADLAGSGRSSRPRQLPGTQSRRAAGCREQLVRAMRSSNAFPDARTPLWWRIACRRACWRCARRGTRWCSTSIRRRAGAVV